MSIHKLIREGRKRLQMTEQQFAEAVSAELGERVTRGSIQQWEKEGGTAPSRKRQPAVAKVLGLTVAQLMGGASNTSEGPAIGGAVPLLSDVQAGNYREFVDNYHPGDGGSELISTSVPVKKHTFALRVTGDSMEPDFPAGMILIVEPEMEPNPGDYVIAKNPAGETTFKQLVKDAGDWFLKPLNKGYPIKPLGDSEIVGVVRAVERRFR